MSYVIEYLPEANKDMDALDNSQSREVLKIIVIAARADEEVFDIAAARLNNG